MSECTVHFGTAARVWLETNLPPGAKVALEAYAPFVNPQRFDVQGFMSMIDHPTQWYVDNGYQYVIFSQGMYGGFYLAPNQYPHQVARYDDFFRRFALVQIFVDGGCEIPILQVGSSD